MTVIRCPHCSAEYSMEGISSKLENGVKLRCASCRQIWNYLSDKELFSDDETDITPLLLKNPLDKREANALSDKGIEHNSKITSKYASKININKRRFLDMFNSSKENKNVPKRKLGWIILIALMIGMITFSALGMAREKITNFYPRTTRFFLLLGFQMRETPLEIEDVNSRIFSEEGKEILEVMGKIVNPTRGDIKPPPLLFALLNEKGEEIYIWTTDDDSSKIPASQKKNFRRRLANPPADSHKIVVRFASHKDISTAMH